MKKELFEFYKNILKNCLSMTNSKILLIILIIIFLFYLDFPKNISRHLKSTKKEFSSDLIKMEKKLNLAFEFIKTYSILFDTAQKGLTKAPEDSFRSIEKNYRKQSKGVGICTMGKKENLYAKEFVEYYLKLGIKKIIIYDNNEIDGEKFEEVLKEYEINKKVEIIDIQGFESVQFPSYMDCYYKNRNHFDFLLFIDFDDFIKIENDIDINTYLYDKKFKKCETIVLNWLMYGDNDLVKYDNRSMVERFTKPNLNWSKGKSIVRTNINNLIISSSHIIGINTKYFCDSNGNRVFPQTFHQFDIPNKPKAYIKHFYTKTAEEFCNKIIKGDVHFTKNHPDYLNIIKGKIDIFFLFNKITNEKLKIIENCSGMNLNMYRKK